MLGDGRCFIQPLLANGATSGHASADEVGQAAYNLYHHCVVKRGVGGIVTNIGRSLGKTPRC